MWVTIVVLRRQVIDGRNVRTRVQSTIQNSIPETVLNSDSASVFKSTPCHKCNNVPTFDAVLTQSLYIIEKFSTFSGKNAKMASRPTMTVGMYIAWPQQTNTGSVRCRSVLCVKSLYKIKNIGLPQQQWQQLPPINQSINQSCLFRVVQVTKSLQDPLEVGNNLPGISDNVREWGLEQKCF